MTHPNEQEIIDISPVLDELEEKLNKISHYCGALLTKINDLYIRLDITSGVIEEVAYALEMSEEDYKLLVQKRVKETKERVEKSPLFNS